MNETEKFWNALAEHHAIIEDNYLDLASLRRIIDQVRSPVLVVGAGQGLLVEELRSKGVQCDGVDSSIEMIRYARIRRGIDLIQADAGAMPLENASYQTIIVATGVVDFNSDENAIYAMLMEGRRVVKPGGKTFVAFYRLSPALENFLKRLGLLSNHVLQHRQSLETYLLTPAQMVEWVGKTARTSWMGGLGLILRLAAFGTFREESTTLKMQRIVRAMANPQAFIKAAPERQPYRDEAEIRGLFARLSIQIHNFSTMATCFVVRI